MQNWVRPSAQKTLLNSDNNQLKKNNKSWNYKMLIWFGVCLQTFQKEIQYLRICSSGTAQVDKKRGECMSFQEWKEILSNAFRRLRKVSLTPLSLCQLSTSGLRLEKKVLKHCIQNIPPPGEVWLKLFAEKKDFWIYTELSLRLKHLGCSKRIPMKLQTLFILHFPLQTLLYKFLFFPKVHNLEKYILCTGSENSSFHYHLCNTSFSVFKVYLEY